MVELGIRLLLAGLVLFLAGVLGIFDFSVAAKAAGVTSAIALFGWRLGAKGLKNPGTAGFIAVVDAFTIAILLSGANLLSHLGFLVLAPCIFASLKHRAPAPFITPLAASSLLVAHSIYHRGEMAGTMLLLQAVAVLGTGLLLGAEEEPATKEALPQLATMETEPPAEYLELRENFRRLRDAYRDLEFKSRRGRMIAALEEARIGQPERFYIRLAAKLKELTQADHLALYTVAEFTDQFVVRATTQDAPSQFQDVQLAVDLNLAPGQIKHRCEQAIASIESTGTQARFANVILIESGRVVGIIALAHSLANSLVEVQARAEEVAPYVASMIQEELRMEIERRRLRETELLYDIASIASGSESVANLASRVARELFASLPADQVSVHWLDSGTPINVASVGANMRMLDAIIEHAWQNEEDWELHLFDARADARIDASAALKNRIGSGAVVPLVGAEGPIGLLVAATHTRGAIDSPQLESLRIAAIELSRAILRLEGTSAKHQGLMTPTEFARAVGKDRGAFVFFEPIRRDHLVEVFGRTAVEHCLQKLARQIRQKLPDGGCICRRDQGDFLVFLPGTSMDRAAKWSDETCGGAALIPVRSVDGTASIPLALRSKVAEFDRQEHGVFDAVSA